MMEVLQMKSNLIFIPAVVALSLVGCGQQRTSPYSNHPPGSTDPVFKLAYAELLKVQDVDGRAVGAAGVRGEFHMLFESIYEHGTEANFGAMAYHTNPVVRVMGLLALKYRNPTLAAVIARHCDTDTTKVCVRDFGCMGFDEQYGDLANNIIESEDFLDTRNLAHKIDAKRKR